MLHFNTHIHTLLHIHCIHTYLMEIGRSVQPHRPKDIDNLSPITFNTYSLVTMSLEGNRREVREGRRERREETRHYAPWEAAGRPIASLSSNLFTNMVIYIRL